MGEPECGRYPGTVMPFGGSSHGPVIFKHTPTPPPPPPLSFRPTKRAGAGLRPPLTRSFFPDFFGSVAGF